MGQTPTTKNPSALWLERAHMLTESLPFMQLYDKKTIIIKFGGHAMSDNTLSASFAQDVVLLKQAGINPIIVHGGGPQIGAMLKRLGIESQFENGLRITDAQTIEVVEMVLTGIINKQIVSALNRAGGLAVGVSGKDGNLLLAKQTNAQKTNLGFVGTPQKITPDILNVMRNSDIIPVIAPLGFDADGTSLNINADTAAGAIAGALRATRLLLLTDIAGILDKDDKLITRLKASKAAPLIRNKTVQDGMIPKLETAIKAIEQGVDAVAILDGRVPHAILLELFTEHGAGTLIE